MFTGYRDETLDFMWGIRLNNDRSWFMEHKEEYLQHLYQPTMDLGREVYDRFTEKFPDIKVNLHVSRIYRDARRLHGRGPYKDHLWFSLRPENDLWASRPVFWFEIEPEGWSSGVGFWNATPAMMAAMRRDMAEHPQRLGELARRLEAQDVFCLQGQTYARPKTGGPAELAEWYNRKNISIGREGPFDDLVCSRELVDVLLEGFAFLVPYYDYFSSFCGGGLEDLK